MTDLDKETKTGKDGAKEGEPLFQDDSYNMEKQNKNIRLQTYMKYVDQTRSGNAWFGFHVALNLY